VYIDWADLRKIDFYDFQINFLQEFPEEAGKQDRERILPYMPGPLDAVNDDITGKKESSGI
jgi:bud emergence protein 1